jgi:hypothetical protein
MKHRTAIVTAASVAVVILAATAAIATNLGILNSGTDTGEVGALTVATTDQTEVPPAPVVVVTDDEATSEPSAPETTSEPAGEITAYAVADAGIVTLENDGSMLTIVDVQANPGWQTAQILDGTGVDVGFVNADGTVLRFIAALDADGSVRTVVEDLTPVISSGDDDDHDDDDDRYESDDDDDDDRYESDDDD